MVDEHPVVIRGASFLKAGAAPVILERTDEDFVDAILAQLPTEPGRLAVAATLMQPPLKGSSAALKLFRPVHRTFHVALVEVSCDIVGQPRLDPARIESAGLVIRRIADGTTGLDPDPAGKGGGKHGKDSGSGGRDASGVDAGRSEAAHVGDDVRGDGAPGSRPGTTPAGRDGGASRDRSAIGAAARRLRQRAAGRTRVESLCYAP